MRWPRQPSWWPRFPPPKPKGRTSLGNLQAQCPPWVRNKYFRAQGDHHRFEATCCRAEAPPAPGAITRRQCRGWRASPPPGPIWMSPTPPTASPSTRAIQRTPTMRHGSSGDTDPNRWDPTSTLSQLRDTGGGNRRTRQPLFLSQLSGNASADESEERQAAEAFVTSSGLPQQPPITSFLLPVSRCPQSQAVLVQSYKCPV